MGENSNFVDFESFDGQENQAVKIIDDFSSEENMLKTAISKKSAIDEMELLYKSAKDEEEKIAIRQIVLQNSYSDDVKLAMLDILDEYIREELKQEIALANSLGEIKKDNGNLKLGAITLVVIGFVVSIWFPVAWIIGIVLAVVGYISSQKENAVKLENAKMAFEKVEKYRKAGWRI